MKIYPYYSKRRSDIARCGNHEKHFSKWKGRKENGFGEGQKGEGCFDEFYGAEYV